MRCVEAGRWISSRVDGEPLPREVESRFEDHLSECPACRNLLQMESDRSRILSRALTAGPGETDQMALAASVIQAARAGKFPGERLKIQNIRRFPFPPVLALAASILILAVAGLWLLPDLMAPPGENPDPVAGALSPGYTIEDSWLDTDLVPVLDGAPIRRGISTRRHIHNIPIGTMDRNKPGELRLEVERVDTRYLQPASWVYR